MAPSDEEITHDFPPFFKVFTDGRIERYQKFEHSPQGLDPVTGVQSKDIVICKESSISGRIFLPEINHQDPAEKLPLLVHYHGGGFADGSAMSTIITTFLNNLANRANVLAVSVEYRLAPEHPLPIAYDDSWAALQWVVSHLQGKGPEPWLNRYADFGRVFIAGESAGATIAHDVMIRATTVAALKEGVKIVGLMLIHPFFGGKGKEVNELYKFMCPTSSGSNDDPRLNPAIDPRFAKMVCERVLVCVGEKDRLKDRGQRYYESLKKSGWGGKVEFFETEGEGHVFYLDKPGSDETEHLLQKLVGFIIQD